MTDKQLREQIDELEDAVWCSRGDNHTQNEAAKERAKAAKIAIMQAVKTYGAYKWADGFNNGMDESKSNALYFLATGRKTIRIADLDTVFGTTPPELTNTGDTSV